LELALSAINLFLCEGADHGWLRVFDYDRIGNGQSSHPSSTEISVASDAFVAHQVVQALRSGRIGGTAFQRVVLIGHSLGSFTSWQEAGEYHDVDGVILTGIAIPTMQPAYNWR